MKKLFNIVTKECDKLAFVMGMLVLILLNL